MVLIDFWTYTCINCLRTLPHLRAWAGRYATTGSRWWGCTRRSSPSSKDTGNVQRAIARNGLHYPVLQDNDYATWTAWGNQYWPAKYLIDGRGRVRYTHFGEGDYDADRAGHPHAAARDRAAAPRRLHAGPRRGGRRRHLTPETYLGYTRAQGFVPARAHAGRAPLRRRPRHAAAQRLRARRHLEGRAGSRPPP